MKTLKKRYLFAKFSFFHFSNYEFFIELELSNVGRKKFNTTIDIIYQGYKYRLDGLTYTRYKSDLLVRGQCHRRI